MKVFTNSNYPAKKKQQKEWSKKEIDHVEKNLAMRDLSFKK
jgi:hypothetical protein